MGAGAQSISSTLQTEMAQTTTMMPQVLTNDVTSSQTLSPAIPRETFASNPSIGYHYPVVDFVLNGATVNNCTLNIDQGAVLAFTAPNSPFSS